LLNPNAPPSPRPPRFIPLTGEPLTYPDPETSSSTLAHRLGEIFSPGLHALHSLAAVPAFIPAKFPRKSQTTIRDFIAEIAGYRVVRGINERWTGVRLEHIRRCADATARDHSRAGVIVLAMGAAKAQITLECVRAGLITELVIDHDLATALLAL